MSSAKYIKTVLNDYKQLPGGKWIKRTPSDKKAKKNKAKAITYKKGLRQRIAKCAERTQERIDSIPSLGEQKIINFFTKNGVDFIREYYNPEVYNPETGNMLYFDFYVPKYHLLIEYDGIHHFKPIHGEEQLRQQKVKDKAKDRWCRKRNWPLLRIPCFEKDIEGMICKAFDKLDPIQ